MAKRTAVVADGVGRKAREADVLADLAWLEKNAPAEFAKCMALLVELSARKIK